MRWLPYPGLSLVVFLTWLALDNTLHPAHLVLAAILAVAVPWSIRRFWPSPRRLREPAVALRLLLRVLGDIVLANIEVARRILGPEAAIRPQFVWVPLDTRDQWAITVLAAIVTLTPGTLSADLSRDRRYLLVHAFNMDDEEALIREIKVRYERPLMTIFDEAAAPGTLRKEASR